MSDHSTPAEEQPRTGGAVIGQDETGVCGHGPEQPADMPVGDVEYTVEARLKGDGPLRSHWVPMAFALRTPAAAREALDKTRAALPNNECRVLRWTATAAVVDPAELDAEQPVTVRPLADKADR
ncbi:hypothetical protein [Streptomyces boncukensis]|uniref:Uncharacterized protein n=1 Tax=Streptomyces boncukensis TaxID=2711219 RepID=A0A6G4WS49_9ACTN|nr:hypothetical protein [Streptomyces boncukensis]NGO68025.1 hypothetical protein [Streptomyces boncukensis]